MLLLGAILVSGLLFRMPVGAEAAAAALIVGGGIGLLGVGIALAGLRHLDRAVSPLPRPTAAATLIEHGLYRSVRHPIYGGVMLTGLGWSIATVSPLAFVLTALLFLLLDLKSRREEAWLRERFPDYADYAKRTKRFIPGLY